ncbi:MAG: PAS domain-containing sensor histidine kinase, partial [Sandaracinaceae bacterium]
DDSGEGVAEAIRERVFQPFVTARIHGIGLGLAIAERFVLAHGGTIQLAQSPLGGARFVVCLPLEEARGDEVET